MTLTLSRLVAAAAAVLAEAGVPSPEADARALAAFTIGVERFPIFEPDELPTDFATRFADLVDQRRQRVPLQHLVGSAPFRYLTMAVRPGVFVPRPETESVAQVGIDEARSLADTGASPVVVDLCCGAGGIALSLATEVPQARVFAVDASSEAVELTRDNASAVGAVLAGLEVGDVRDEHLLANLSGLVQVLVSNPPYIPPDQVPIDPEVRDHDPALALYGGGLDGLDVPRAVIQAAHRLVAPGGLFVMEHADSQGEQARDAIAAIGGWTEIRTLPDLTGRDRMLVARRSA